MDELLAEAVENIEEEKALFLARKMLENGASREEIMADVQKGLDGIGILFENSEYFIADLMMAGILYKEILTLDGMRDADVDKEEDLGVLMVATVEGDLHDIGKDIFAGMAQAGGFKVIDLGVDVKSEVIMENVRKYKPDVLGLSAILTHAAKTVKEVIAVIDENELHDGMKIIIGGSAFKNVIPAGLNADGIAADANDGVKIIKQWAREGADK